MNDTTEQLKANTQAVRENLASLKALSQMQLTAQLDKNRKELAAFKGDADGVFQGVFRGLEKNFQQTLDFRKIMQHSLNETSKQIQKVIQQSVGQAIQQAVGGKMQGGFGGLLQAPLAGLFKSSQGQGMADAAKAIGRGQRNL